MVDLPPPSPIYEHRQGVWVKESWLRFFGITLQTRMVVLQLDGGLLLYSPSPAVLDSTTREELERLGVVRWLVAPNEIHNLGLRAFQTAFADAHVTGCVGHPRRVHGVRFDTLLGAGAGPDAVPWSASGELALHVIGGNRLLHEIALLHRPSKTLLVADAVELIDENVTGGAPLGRLMTWLLRRVGLRPGEPCMSPEHNLYCADPDALSASLQVLAGWDFDSLVMAHGRIVEGAQARRALQLASESALAAIRNRSAAARAFWAATARVQ